MTYMDLLETLQSLTYEELAQNVTVHVPEADEFYPVEFVYTSCEKENDVLDDGHIYLVTQP